ncbi:MAG TPA: ankyrin repeat domain-containing protein, partial [Nitrososphaeraceae archaeon]|nr:ankyrin repeat domain-containing protein [Nitrososphaeraceae archaeon]
MKSKTEVADIVIVIGNDEGEETHHQTFFKEVRETCEKLGLKYTILGDGKSGFLEDEILLLPKTKHLAIQAHGEIKNGTHTIVLDDEINKKTLKFIKRLQDQTGSQNIILGSCFGGKVIDELENSKIRLLQNTFLFVGSAPDEFSLYHDNVLIHNILLKNIKKHGHRLNMPLLVRDVIKTIPQTLVLSYQPSPLEEADIPLQTLTLRRMDREIIFEIIKLCQYKLDAFNKFLGKILHGIYDPFFIDQLKMDYNIPDMSDKFNLINLEMNQEEINYYRTTSIINHVFHRDIKLINALLKDHPFSSSLMYEIILSKYSNSDHMEHIMDILLSNLHNAADNQSIDTFQQGFFIPEKDYTPLTLALEKNRIELAKLLIIHGANIYLPDKKGRTPIDIIKKNSQQTIFNQIFFDAKSIYDMIMLIESDSINKKHPKFKLILNAYNDFLKLCQKENCIDFLNSPFSLSTHKNLFSKFQHFIFLAHEIRNEIPAIAYLYMENIDQPDLKNQLLKKINHQFFSAIIKDNTRLVSNLMNAGFNINSTIHENETPLYIALNNKNYTMAKMLIKKGA